MPTKSHHSIQNLKQQQFFLQILILGFIIAFFWIFVSLFRSQQADVISPELQQLAVPLNPNLDEAVIRRLEQKQPISALLDAVPAVLQNRPTIPVVITIGSSSASPVPSPAPSPRPPTTTASATPLPSPTGTSLFPATTASPSSQPSSGN
jgi:hypothetical protein